MVTLDERRLGRQREDSQLREPRFIYTPPENGHLNVNTRQSLMTCTVPKDTLLIAIPSAGTHILNFRNPDHSPPLPRRARHVRLDLQFCCIVSVLLPSGHTRQSGFASSPRNMIISRALFVVLISLIGV